MSKISFTLNFERVEIDTNPLRRLLDVLREDFNLTGLKEGCGEGECGSCSIILDGRLVKSCLIPLGNIEGKDVLTIEGLQKTNRYEVLKEAFEEAGAVQCGFCTPGMIMAAEALLRNNPKPTVEEIKDGLSGNLCRCTGYNMIIEAVQRASNGGDGLW